ncbi:site-specific DNA-methyltransferase [Pelomicrobium methylotrophicum]|nr:site-specific DNA-methyltransferase [Pelomicrobium methylotrophicum]
MNDDKPVTSAMPEPEKLDLRSHDIAADKRAELLRLFPEIRTEGGKLDFEKLRLALGEAVDMGRERFGLTWPGKAECFKAIQTPSLGTLRPAPEESVNFDTTENLIIEGDNLEVLKLLQKSYLGKVKMIYIDPPYNTGNDFIYPDDYSESLRTYLEYTGQVDAEGKRFSTNTDTDGRFHSKWLNMMYPRLYLARNLLREDGVIFVSIDDTELANLMLIMNDIFGEENQLAIIAWEKRFTRSNNAKLFAKVKDSIVAYRKSEAVQKLREARTEKSDEIYSNPDNDPRGPWTSVSFVNPATKEERPNLVYEITNPFTGKRVIHPTNAWKQEKEKAEQYARENRFYWGKNGTYEYPRLKKFLYEVQDGVVPVDLWAHEATGTTDEGSKTLDDILGKDIFDNPKPTRLIHRMLGIVTKGGTEPEIILDFFAGSGTTAHAVLELNKQDGGNRKFILVQLPEPVDPESPAGKAGFKTIADICKERVRRVIQKLNDEDAGKLDLEGQKQDRGFRVFKLAESNFKVWDATAPKDAESLAQQLELHVDHIREGRSEQDILFEILLKSGFALTTPVETRALAGKRVYRIADGAMLICLERALTLEAIRAMAAEKPARVVCLDAGFAGNDQLKANAVQTFKTAGVASFKTV